MKTTIRIAVGALACGALLGVGVQVSSAERDSKQIGRGKHLTMTSGCTDCHAPLKMGPNGPENDLSRGLIGHPQELRMPPAPKMGEGPWVWIGSGTTTAFAGPWGVSYAANLTPDPETGIGKWREVDFVNAIRTGKHLGVGRPIMPPMPWPAYRNMTDEELRAIYAYLMSQAPVKNRVPDYQPPQPR